MSNKKGFKGTIRMHSRREYSGLPSKKLMTIKRQFNLIKS